ncbi:MAG: hypothetical protein IIX84_00310, partial [Oscillospiraceae bacterium]|nr:hypothetical protein [Oscillospiraceae bacterium]
FEWLQCIDCYGIVDFEPITFDASATEVDQVVAQLYHDGEGFVLKLSGHGDVYSTKRASQRYGSNTARQEFMPLTLEKISSLPY